MVIREHTASFTVDLPADFVWAICADTQHLNELLFGLSPTKVLSRTPDRARLAGTFGAFAPEYDEIPWEFEAPRYYKSRREFVRGLLVSLETECQVDDDENDEGTRIRYTTRWEGIHNTVGRIASTLAVRKSRQAARRLENFLRNQHASANTTLLWPATNAQREAVLLRARPFATRLTADGSDDAVVERLLAALADLPEADAARLRPYELADAWALARKEVLSVFLNAAAIGLLRLSWDLICPSCEAATPFSSLKELPEGIHCPSCDIDVHAAWETNVEATFSPSPAVRAVDRVVFCHGSIANVSNRIAQVRVGPGEQRMLRVRLGEGRYEIRTPGPARPLRLEVAAGGFTEWHVLLEEKAGRLSFGDPAPTLGQGILTLCLENSTHEERRFQLAHRRTASRAATAADVTSLGLFRSLFSHEVLGPEQHISVGHTTLMFTDLVGSTAMYDRVGDARAFSVVREHFRLLEAAIQQHHGNVVKTIGDAVMAAFDESDDAVRAGLDCIRALRALRDPTGGDPNLQLRVGVHVGPCLAVTANGAIDYFGQTVNVASRVQALAGGDELIVSQAVFGTRAPHGVMPEEMLVARERCDVKGIPDPLTVFRITVPRDRAKVGVAP